MNKKILTVVIDLEKGGAQRAAQNFAMGYKYLGYDSRVLYIRDINKNDNYRARILRKKISKFILFLIIKIFYN